MATITDWDALWQRVYDREVHRGATPNAAIFTAFRGTEAILGPRPEHPLTAEDLIMPAEEWS